MSHFRTVSACLVSKVTDDKPHIHFQRRDNSFAVYKRHVHTFISQQEHSKCSWVQVPHTMESNCHWCFEIKDGNDILYDIQQLSELKTYSPVKKKSPIIKTNTLTKFNNSKKLPILIRKKVWFDPFYLGLLTLHEAQRFQEDPCYFSKWDSLLMLINQNMCYKVLLLFDCVHMLFMDAC